MSNDLLPGDLLEHKAHTVVWWLTSRRDAVDDGAATVARNWWLEWETLDNLGTCLVIAPAGAPAHRVLVIVGGRPGLLNHERLKRVSP
jgi:hypothetical protein